MKVSLSRMRELKVPLTVARAMSLKALLRVFWGCVPRSIERLHN